MKGRYCEVDVINGLVVEENGKRDLPSPANQAVVEITRRIHSGELKMDPSNLDIVKDLLRA